VNKQIAALQSYVKHRSAKNTNKTPESRLVEEHNNNVVMLLQSKLADTSMTFKDVLEIRTQVSTANRSKATQRFILCQNMKESKDRTEQFMHSTSAAANPAPSSKCAALGDFES
jgi:syntaxin 5